MKSIAVCMATYNGEKFIADQLHSIMNQSLKPKQLIISDDCSSDKTVEIINRISCKADFEVKININDRRLGVVKNFEKAISQCNADITVLADQDDLWDPNRLQHVFNIFNKKEVDYYFSDSKIIDSFGRLQNISLWELRSFNKKSQRSFNKNQLPILLKYNNFIYGMTLAFKSKIITEIIPIKSKSSLLTHDGWIPMILSGLNYIGYADSVSTTYYRQHNDQVAGSGKKTSFIMKLISSFKNKRNYDLDLPNDLEEIAIKITSGKNPSFQSLKSSRLFKEKASHLRFRANLQNLNMFERFKKIIIEVISGKYKRYSSSKLTFLRDIIG